ncbi:phosphoglucosamine mutase [Elusimicrobium posterum]|uniref:phosphoglucosamine mutase n=1 Tax=Elusimicrobium posterum TaxID=3116653 RepID=UPI003C7570BC
MPKYFGTDGVRAVAGQFPLVQDFVEKLGYAAVHEIKKNMPKGAKKTVILAEDSRASGPLLMSYLTTGINAAGFDVISIGVAPTPAVSFLVQHLNLACGAVISASHNPAEFNGIKFFDHTGAKIDEVLEEKIENILDATHKLPEKQNAEFSYDETLLLNYQNFLVNTVPQNLLKDTKIVLDCANGATSKIAPMVFEALGADIITIANTPNGKNINDNVGALHIEKMQAAVKENNAFCGFSFDGDGDRVIAADEQGREIDGDHIISGVAKILQAKKELKNNKVVLTIMANLAAINFLKDSGIDVELTGVGDKYVAQALIDGKLTLGGETSGHIIFNEISPTGDGILAALQMLACVKGANKKLSSFYDNWKKYPNVLTAVKVQTKVPLEEVEGFNELAQDFEKQFNGKGRLVIRYSGTEPKLRILAEGENEELVNRAACELEKHFRERVK